ncbi:MAG: hypothetical protein ABEK16_05750 [Candidatus Nanohalobium sp.]
MATGNPGNRIGTPMEEPAAAHPTDPNHGDYLVSELQEGSEAVYIGDGKYDSIQEASEDTGLSVTQIEAIMEGSEADLRDIALEDRAAPLVPEVDSSSVEPDDSKAPDHYDQMADDGYADSRPSDSYTAREVPNDAPMVPDVGGTEGQPEYSAEEDPALFEGAETRFGGRDVEIPGGVDPEEEAGR